LLDEPTNHLDIESKELLETALLDYQGTLVIISHDRYFINKIADYIYILENKKLQYFNGNYEEYSKKQVVDELPKEKKPSKKLTEKKIKEKTIVINYVELIEEVDNLIASELNKLSPDYNKIGEWVKEKERLEEAWLESMK